MDKRRLLLGGALAISLAAGSAAIYGGARHNTNEAEARQKAVASMVEKLKACPDRGSPDCLDHRQRSKLLASAVSFDKLGDYENAGLAYVELGRDDDALSMAKKCADGGDSEAAGRITDALRVRAEALSVSAKDDAAAGSKAYIPAAQAENLKLRAEKAEKSMLSAADRVEKLTKDLAACNAALQEARR